MACHEKRCSNSSYDVLLECPNIQYIVFNTGIFGLFTDTLRNRLPKSESERRTIVVRWNEEQNNAEKTSGSLQGCLWNQTRRPKSRSDGWSGHHWWWCSGQVPPPFSPVLILLFPRLSQYLSPLWVLTLQLCVVSCLLIFPLASRPPPGPTIHTTSPRSPNHRHMKHYLTYSIELSLIWESFGEHWITHILPMMFLGLGVLPLKYELGNSYTIL